MLRILIAGCGDVGTALARQLHESGHRVWGLRRTAAEMPSGISAIQADLTQPETLADLPPDLNAVVYAAAADERSDSAYEAAYDAGVENLIQALRRRQRSSLRLLMTSSTSVYTQDDGGWVDEASPAESESSRTRAILRGESRVLGAPCQGVVVRFGGIYGPGRLALLRRVLRAGATCSEGLYSNRIHRDDCARVLLHLLTLRNPRPVYLGVDCEPAPICEVMAWLAQRLGVPPPSILQSVEHRDGARARTNKRCSNGLLQATGYRFLYPSYREGYREILANLGPGELAG